MANYIELKNHTVKVNQNITKALTNAIEKTVKDIEAEAKYLAPVDTGNLKNSITSNMLDSSNGEVSVGAEYAAYQEFGSVKMAAHPFLTPACDKVFPNYGKLVKSLLGGK